MTKDAMTQQPGLRGGSLAGQDLSLLNAGSSVLLCNDNGALAHELGPLCLFAEGDKECGFAVLSVSSAPNQFYVVDRFSYIGEDRDGDGWIHAPEGGWSENPVPGMRVDVRIADYDSTPEGDRTVMMDDELSDHIRWDRSILAFRPAPSAVEPAPEAVSPEGEAYRHHPLDIEQDLCGACQKMHDVADLQPHGFCLRCTEIARVVASHTPEQPDSRSGAVSEAIRAKYEKVKATTYRAGTPAERMKDGKLDGLNTALAIAMVVEDRLAPTQPQQPDTLAEGLEDLFLRLDDILVEESPMHPFGCATWEESSRIAVDMAKYQLAEATRLLAEARARIIEMEGEKAALNNALIHVGNNAERDRLAAEADAAKLWEALEKANAALGPFAHIASQVGLPADKTFHVTTLSGQHVATVNREDFWKARQAQTKGRT